VTQTPTFTSEPTPTETFTEPTPEGVQLPDIELTKAFGRPCQAGKTTTFTIRIRNIGGPTSGPIVLTDPMPTGLTLLPPPNAPGWDCTASTPAMLSCTYNPILAPNGQMSVAATAQVQANFSGQAINTATANTTGDIAIANNVDSAVCSRPAPAPAASPGALFLGLLAMLGVAGVAMRRRYRA
jgi:uncharacterized repeat protein (TIGR01451 family)